jgi:hypothetical protein
MNLYIAQKICLGHRDGKMYECGKFLKHSLPQGYIAGLGRDVLATFSSDDILAVHSRIRLAVL